MTENKLDKAKNNFIAQWGILGSNWGVNRTFAQIQALLMLSKDPLCTDDVMQRLSISRGNAHANLKDLVSWGIAKVEIKPGDRKEYFIGEKEPWKLFCAISNERRRREISPTLEVLKSCIEDTKEIKSNEAQQFYKQINDLNDFIVSGERALERVVSSKKSSMFTWLLKLLN